MDRYGYWGNSGYQLSLDNFAGAGQKLSGLELLICEIINKSNLGYNIDKDLSIHAGYYITSNYDSEDFIPKLQSMDGVQLGYIHYLFSESIRHCELASEFGRIDSTILATSNGLHQIKKKIYAKIQNIESEKPIVIIDFDTEREYCLKKVYDGKLPEYVLESKEEKAPFNDKYIREGAACAINHYYSFSAAHKSREEADLCWNIFTAKPDIP